MIRTFARGVLRAVGHAYPFHRTARVVHNRLFRWATATLTEPRPIRCRNGAIIVAKPSELIGHQLYVTGVWDPHLLRVLRDACPADARVIVDVGANVGFFSLALAMTARQSRVHAVEPQPRLAEQLRRSAAETGLSNVIVHGFALSSTTGHATLVLNERNLGASGIGQSQPDGEGMIRVPTLNGADFLDSLGVREVDLMKVDVEGHEAHVFRGIERWLDSHRIRAVVFESRALGDDRNAALMLARRGYLLFGISKGLLGPVLREWSGTAVGGSAEDMLAVRPADVGLVRGRLARFFERHRPAPASGPRGGAPASARTPAPRA